MEFMGMGSPFASPPPGPGAAGAGYGSTGVESKDEDRELAAHTADLRSAQSMRRQTWAPESGGGADRSRAADYSDYSTSGAEDEDDVEDAHEFAQFNRILPRRQTWTRADATSTQNGHDDDEADGAAADAHGGDAGTEPGTGLGAAWKARVRRSQSAPRTSLFKKWGHSKKRLGEAGWYRWWTDPTFV